MLTVIIFLIILSVLVIVHELGHFLTAKAAGIRVDEFGLGYPPRAKRLFAWKGTDFTLNWLPFGGFVKIFGENPSEGGEDADPASFGAKSRWTQVGVLVAGVTANFIFGWFLISVGFTLGLPAALDSGLPTTGATYTTITEVVPHSPAEAAGLKSGDRILAVHRGNLSADLAPDQVSNFIASSPQPVSLEVLRGSQDLTLSVTPDATAVPGKLAIGIGLDTVGLVKLSFFPAIWQGLKTAGRLTWYTLTSFLGLIHDALLGHANLSEVTGPVGIVSLVGSARALGFSYLLSLTALISINLTIINLLPIPALDGGRIFFIAIEAIRRKKISPKIFNAINNASFVILLILMVLITIRDVANLL